MDGIKGAPKGQMSRARFKYWLGNWQEWGSVIFLFLTLAIAPNEFVRGRK